jgi:hypothetical protein
MLNIFNRIKNYLIGFLFVFSLVIGILYLTTQNRLESLQSKYTKLQTLYDNVVEDKKKLEDSIAVTDKVEVVKEEKIITIKDSSCKDVERILTYKQPKQSTPKGDKDEVEHVDLDTPFSPDDLRMYKSTD